MQFKRILQVFAIFVLLLGNIGHVQAQAPQTALSIEINPTTLIAGETAVVSILLENVPAEGYTSAEFTCTYDPAHVSVSEISVADLFGADPATAINDPQAGMFIFAVAGKGGIKATADGTVFTFNAAGIQIGATTINCAARVSQGDDQLIDILPGTNTLTVNPTTGNWLTFTNPVYGFQFKYPSQGVIAEGATDVFARIDLSFTAGTNLREKYLEVIVQEFSSPCQSPLASQSMLQTSEMVTLNGIPFLKETGADAGAGNIYQWVAYSTPRDEACISLDFILHSLNPDNYEVPPPVFDYAAETALFDTSVSTFEWLVIPDGIFGGQVFASKPVTISVFSEGGTPITESLANMDGTFNLPLPPRTYVVFAKASGFLSAQGSVTVTSDILSTLPTISLLAGDIDGNNVIDQFDAMTIGMNYNTATPEPADLNSDGIINVLDLEALAKNYRVAGVQSWQ